MMYEETDAKD